MTQRHEWLPSQQGLSERNTLSAALAALAAIAVVTWVSYHTLHGFGSPILIASMGASTVLLFAAPSSPMSKPWPFVGGHIIATSVGVICYQALPDVLLAAPFAVALSIVAMGLLRCLHPPGGAAALAVVLGDQTIHDMGFQFVLAPVAINAFLLLACATLYWQLSARFFAASTGHSSSLEHNWQRRQEPWLGHTTLVEAPHLEAALNDMETYIDVSIQDLTEIINRARHHAHTAQLGQLKCRNIMSQPVVTVSYGTSLQEVWELFESHHIRGVPVVNMANRVEGMVTVSDFIHHAHPLDGDSLVEKLIQLRTPTPGFESNKPEVAGQIMTTAVITIDEDEVLTNLVDIFSRHNIHHLPIVNAQQKLVGMLTREDIMAAISGTDATPAENALPLETHQAN